MLSRPLAASVALSALLVAPAARAEVQPASGLAPATAAPGAGLVVLAEGASVTEPARALAFALYRTRLRPAAVDEAAARVLVGQPPADGAAADVRELAELRAGVHGDDAASRQVLVEVARRLHAEGVVVVREGPAARLFSSKTAAFEPVVLQPDAGGASWNAAVSWLDRGSGQGAAPGGAASGARAAAYVPVETPRTEPRPFYASPWLWGGVAGAVALGALFFVATSSSNDAGVPMRLEVAR